MGVLLDRDAELGELGWRIASARSGSGRVIVVEGPAGIGKSTLLRAAGRGARADGATVLWARCSPLEQDAAWGMARQLFEPLRARQEWGALTVGAAGLAERALAPDGGDPAPAGDAMHAAVRGLVWLVGNLADRGPAVLVIDDVHWADPPSLRWLALLAGSLDELPVAVLCAVRAGEPAAAPELLAELLASAAEPPVRPRALGPVAAETLVRQRLPAASEGFAHACHAVTGGNPFLLGALLTQLIADAVAPDDETAARLGTFGSEQVARVIERQLARLPEGARPLAQAVAVLGPGAPLRHAAALAGIQLPTAAARVADALRAAGLLDDTTELALAHPLIAGTVYTSMPAGARALHHAHAAAMLARERAEPERVALHLLRTEPAGDSATVATLRDAASRASARGAPQTAATYLRRALAEPPATGGEAADVRLALALALAAYLNRDAYRLLQEAVDTADTAVQRGTIALAGARACTLAGRFDTAIALCRSGLEAADGIPAQLTRLEAELIATAWGQASTAHKARERTRRPARRPPGLELWRINAAWDAVCDGRRARKALMLLTGALDAGALDNDSDSVLATFAKVILIACGELDAAREQCAALIDVARPRGWLVGLAHGCLVRAIALVQMGQIRDAEADARLSVDIGLSQIPPAALIWAVFPLVDALTELGEFDAADAVLATMDLGDPPIGVLAGPMLLESRARLRLAQQRHADAHADLLAAADRWRELGIRHPGLAAWRVHACEALVAQGELSAARELAEEHLALAERLGLPGPRGAGLRALARTADRNEAVDLLEQAVDLLAGSPTQLEHVRTLVDLGATLRRTNRRAAARTPLRRALDLATRGGMRLLADRARHELHTAGARPRRPHLSGCDSLTPAEHKVATLAAQGHSNPEIAQQLYITRRTGRTSPISSRSWASRSALTSRHVSPAPSHRNNPGQRAKNSAPQRSRHTAAEPVGHRGSRKPRFVSTPHSRRRRVPTSDCRPAKSYALPIRPATPPRLPSTSTARSSPPLRLQAGSLRAPLLVLLRDPPAFQPIARSLLLPRRSISLTATRSDAGRCPFDRWLSRKPRQPAFRCVEVTTARSRWRSIESKESIDCRETALCEVGPDLPGRAIVTGQQRDLFVRQPPRQGGLSPPSSRCSRRDESRCRE
ncbi:MAG TPA: AAA family ATPase [Solirubrobacteraceae bacterium]|nr:AAA family ATPase [Solirubrobacteraceae bacterium]